MESNIILNKKKISENENLAHKFTVFIRENGQLYLMALPAMILLFLFAYMPMGGIVIAFKNFQFSKGIWGSEWMHPLLYNFQILFKNNPQALIAMKNTLLLNTMFILVGTAVALALALLFNEVSHSVYKKLTQSISFLPHFISPIVVGVFVTALLNFDSGIVNKMIVSLGFHKIQFYMDPKYWPFILLVVNIWKGAGYGSIVYLATIAGIDSSYYEASKIDGAGRWQQIWYISLPLIRPTVVILTILAFGRIMNADFGLFYYVTGDMPTLYPTTDVIDTFIYRSLRQSGDIGISSATGFFQSVVSFFLVLFSNTIAKKIEKDAAIF